MTRYIYGGGGDAQSVTTTGTVRPSTSGTVYNARTGGSIVTDIQSITGTALSGTITTDAYGQALFLGPDGYRSVLWLDFGIGPRWALPPKDTNLIFSDYLTSWAAGGPTISGGPILLDGAAKASTTSAACFQINALTGQTGDLQRWKVNGVIKANIDSSGNLFATNFPGTAAQTYTPTLTAATTSPTLGSGSVQAGLYVQLGKLVFFNAKVQFGSSGAAAGSGNYRISVPVAANLTADQIGINGRITCAGVTGYVGTNDPTWVDSTHFNLQVIQQTTGRQISVTNAAPGTFTNNDVIRVSGCYIAA